MPTISEGHAAEEYLPDNVRRHRERLGLSQAAVAKAMQERGWPWHQATVYRVENDKQGIGLGEATDLAAILGVSTDRLSWAGPEANEAAMVDRSTAILHREWEETADAVARLHAAIDGAGRALAQSGESRYERVRQACADLGLELEASTLKAAVEEGTARWRREAEG